MAIIAAAQLFTVLYNGLKITALVLAILCMIKYLKK